MFSLDNINYNQNVLENNSCEVYELFNNLIYNHKNDLLEHMFVPFYLHISNYKNGHNSFKNFYNIDIARNLYYLIKSFKYVFKKNIIFDNNPLLKEFLNDSAFIIPHFKLYKKTKEVDNALELLRYTFSLDSSVLLYLKKSLLVTQSIKNYIKYFERYANFKNIYTGTCSKPLNHIFTSIFFKNSTIHRFSHGGDRGFFVDKLFYRCEFRNTSYYYVHGTHEYNGLNYKNKKIKYSMYLKNLNIFSKKDCWSDTIVYSLPSNVFPNHHYPMIKYSDQNQFKIQFEIIRLFKKSGYKVLIKKHPKGRQIDHPYYDYADGILDLSLQNALNHYSNWVFDIFGTALIECATANKNIIYFDLGLRQKSLYFNVLYERLYILENFQLPSFNFLKTFFNDHEEANTIFNRKFFL